MVIESAAGTAFTTPADIALSAGWRCAGGIAVGYPCGRGACLCAVAGAAASLFAQQGGIRGIAAEGPLSLRAQTDRVDMRAGRDIAILSSNGAIEILARDRIALGAANAVVTLQGGDVMFHCPAEFSVRGRGHVVQGPASDRAQLPDLPRAIDG